MSHPLLLALFHDRGSAAAAAREVHALGIGREALSIVAGDHHIEGQIAEQIGGSPGSDIEDSPAASRLGELGGYILAAIAIGMPGTGALVVAGPLAAELGEAAGHAAGDLKATLLKAGLAERDAEQWRAEIERGSILLGVHASSANAAQVESALARHSGGQVVRTQWSDD